MNLTIGKYIPGDSFIHKMDPRLKLFTNILFIILVFIADGFLTQAFLLIPIFIAFIFSQIPKNQIIRMLYPVGMIGLFLFLINAFVIKESTTGLVNYASFWIFNISNIAIHRTLIIMLRIFIMIMITTMLTSTTKPVALTRGIEDLLWPLKFLFIPIHIIAMIISIALRFIPTLLEESQRIMKAQASRGVDFKNGNHKSKVKSIITLIIPLFVSAFAKAEDLGNAMTTRGYNPYEKRTKYREYPIKRTDIIVFLTIVTIGILLILNKTDVLIFPSWV